MIVLPLTEEARSGRRPPWVTLALVTACALVFLHHRGSDREVDERTDAALGDAWAYFVAHPYVKVDEHLAEMLGEDEVAFVSQAFREQVLASGSPGIPDFVRSHDQFEFERRVERIYEAVGDHSFYRLGFFPEAMSAPDASFLTYVLVHEDWLHLLTNLAFVLLAGLFLEEVWGRGLFLMFVLTGAVAGAVGYATLDPDAAEALGGASGLAAALAGAFLVRFATVPIRFRYFYVPPFGGRFTARGWVTLPIYGSLYFVADYVLTQGAPGIDPVSAEFATWAHVGGFAWGLLFALGIKALRIEERFIHPKIEKKLTTRSNPMLDQALEAREAGRAEEAFELLAREVSRHPEDRDAALAFWDAATAVERPEKAAEALVRVLRGEVASGPKELAIQHWRELRQRVPDFAVDSALEVRIVGLLIEAGEHDLASFSARRVLDGTCGAVAGATAHQLARLTQDLDADIALGAARRALAANDLDPAEAQDVQRLAEQLEGLIRRAHPEPEDPSGGYDRDDRSFDTVDGSVDGFDTIDTEEQGAAQAGGDAGPDLDGDTLNAAPFELDDLTPPPGVRTYDLENDAAEASLPGIAEIPLDDSTVPPLDAGTVPPLDAGTVPPLDAGTVPPLDEATAPSLDTSPDSPFDAADLPPLESLTTPPLCVEASTMPPRDSVEADAMPQGDGSEPQLGAAPEAGSDVPELDRSSPDLSLGGGEDGPIMTVVVDALTGPGETSGASQPSSGPSMTEDLGASLPGLDEGTPDLSEEVPGLDASLPGLGASLPGLGDDGVGRAHGALDLGESAPDLGLSAPSSPRPGDDSILRGDDAEDIPLADESVQTSRRVSVDDRDAPDFGNTIDLASLGAETIPGYDVNDLAPPPPPSRPAPGPSAGADLEVPRPPRTLKKMEAIPLALGDDGVTLDVGERGKAQLALARIDAIAVAGVRGLRPKPVVVIDLVTNWLVTDRQPLKVVRLRSDRFDPCNLVPGETNGFQALKRWIDQLIAGTGALALPDANSAAGAPFRMFDDLAAYEREVLRVL